MVINKLGVVGCGVTGSAFAQAFAASGYEVVVYDITIDLLNKGLALIESRLGVGPNAKKLSSQDKHVIMGRIEGTNSE